MIFKNNVHPAMQSRYGHFIFRALVGSHSYGTAIETSDHDYKGVYVQAEDDILSFRYKEQFEESKDEVYYEVRRFIQLLQSANPTVLELLFAPEDCIVLMSAPFQLILNQKQHFLTKQCFASFGGYAIAQIQKAKGLNKKMNWEGARIQRKTPLDFCYAYEDGKTFPLSDFLSERGLTQERCGLVALNHFEHCYALYYDTAPTPDVEPTSAYRGIIADDSNDVRLSSVPKGAQPLTIMNFNKSAYSQHCRQYREYEQWLRERNTQRYVDIQGHQQKIDGKNLLHCRRLLDMALEIAEHGTLTVRRPNAEYLLKIRRGEVDLESIIEQAEADIERLNSLQDASQLAEKADMNLCNDLVLEVRYAMRSAMRDTMRSTA